MLAVRQRLMSRIIFELRNLNGSHCAACLRRQAVWLDIGLSLSLSSKEYKTVEPNSLTHSARVCGMQAWQSTHACQAPDTAIRFLGKDPIRCIQTKRTFTPYMSMSDRAKSNIPAQEFIFLLQHHLVRLYFWIKKK
jgi:hypothetical protein